MIFNKPITVEGPSVYNGVPVTDRRIIDGIETLIKKGYHNRDIVRIIGMPQEIVDKVRHRMSESKKT